MSDRSLFIVTLCAVLGCGLIAGVFYAFSTFVMRALARLPADAGVAAMQSINVVVINPMFLGVFLGTGVVCLVAIVAAALRWNAPGAAYLLVGGVLYLIGTVGVTIAGNVLLNNALARVSPSDADAGPRWSDYVNRWTAWNHVRTAAALAAAASFALALRREALP